MFSLIDVYTVTQYIYQTLGGIPIGLGMVMKINFLNFNIIYTTLLDGEYQHFIEI